MHLDMTKADYLRLTGRLYELHERRSAGPKNPPKDDEPPEDEPPPEDDEPTDDEEVPETDDAEVAADDDEIPDAGVDDDPDAPRSVKPKEPDDSEKPLPANKDGIVKKARGRWPSRPQNSISASLDPPRARARLRG